MPHKAFMHLSGKSDMKKAFRSGAVAAASTFAARAHATPGWPIAAESG
jgi:hypothetical protein